MERGARGALRGAFRWVLGANATVSSPPVAGQTWSNRANLSTKAKAKAATGSTAHVPHEAPPPNEAVPPSMLSGVLSMVLGAGGAILVAGIGCMAVFQMVLSVSEQAGRIKKYEPAVNRETTAPQAGVAEGTNNDHR